MLFNLSGTLKFLCVQAARLDRRGKTANYNQRTLFSPGRPLAAAGEILSYSLFSISNRYCRHFFINIFKTFTLMCLPNTGKF
ncbi:MAG: hypothetical protein JWR09_1516 [Mucilaginibacter sp.]|nr:hypothetical protein [Mucilaginibacter sp.]